MSASACRVPGCRGAVEIVLDAGAHPVSNGYVRADQEPLYRPLKLCRCAGCGLVQFVGTFTEEELAGAVPDWVRYNEPEAHLDEFAGWLGDLMKQDRSRHVAGLTSLDQSLQDRLKKAGWESQTAVDIENGVDADVRCSIEAMLAGVHGRLWKPPGRKCDLLLVRHVFDHVRDFSAFCSFIRSCVNAHGLVVFEVPSAIRDIEARNPLMLWESHANHFTPRTLVRTLESAGLNVRAFRQFSVEGPPLLGVVCSPEQRATVCAEQLEEVSDAALKAYVSAFEPNGEMLRKKMAALRQQHANAVMLGAGHMGNLFLNLHGLGRYLDCAVDDDPRKSGLLLPGSRLPIQAGSPLAGIDDLFILMAVNPAVEEKVITRWRQQNPSAVFASIFAQSSRSVLLL